MTAITEHDSSYGDMNWDSIINAYTEVEVVIKELSSIRGSAELFHSWYVQAEVFATEVGVVPDVQRLGSAIVTM